MKFSAKTICIYCGTEQIADFEFDERDITTKSRTFKCVHESCERSSTIPEENFLAKVRRERERASKSRPVDVPTAQALVPSTRIKTDRPTTNGNAAKDDDSFIATIGAAVAPSPIDTLAQLNQIKLGLDVLSERFKLLVSHHDQFVNFRSKFFDFLKTKPFDAVTEEVGKLPSLVAEQHKSILDEAEARSDALKATLEARLLEVREGLDAIRGAIEARPAAPPAVAVDAPAIAARILEGLTADDGLPSLFHRIAEDHFRGRNADLMQVVKGLPRLFDAIEGPLNTWRLGAKLGDEKREFQRPVLDVLEAIKQDLDDWKRVQAIEGVPPGPDGSRPYDPRWHNLVAVEPTADRARHETIAWTTRPGYRWNGERLRKEDVVVYEATVVEDEGDGNSAAALTDPDPPQGPPPE